MIYNKNNLAVAKIASKNKSRRSIAGVLFTPEKTVATDSFRLIEMSVPKDVKADAFPMPEGMKADNFVGSFVIDAESLKGFTLPNVSSMPILNNTVVSKQDEKSVDFFRKDLNNESFQTFRKVDEDYPEYEGIFPTGKPQAEISVNAKFLKDLVGILGNLDKQSSKVRIAIYPNGKPMVITAKNNEQEGRAMLMPISE